MRVVTTFSEVRETAGGTVALVPTMGFLHEGHLACLAAVRDGCETLVMSLFVNPLQFDDPADLERYPRAGDRDAALAESAGVDLLFAPTLDEMYLDPPLTRVEVAEVTEQMEGAERPGHFSGVATVVTKLFAGIRPDLAAFGRKDAQQLAVVRRAAADLSFPVEIVGVSTVREHDGLALSSRNVFIEDRAAALSLSRGLFAAADSAADGERSGPILEGIVAAAIERVEGVELEYVALADADLARRVPELERRCFLAVAARVGPVRLIDNVVLESDGTSDRGVRLAGESLLYGED